MKNNDKTKEQLINELTKMHHRVAELKKSEIEHKRADQRLSKEVELKNFLLDLYEKASALTDKDLYDYVLDRVVRLTDSTIGFFHLVSDDQKNVILTTWNTEALKNCTASYTTHYPLDQAGNWVDCVRLRRPVLYNEFSRSPNQKGLPEGHTFLRRFMSVPVVEGDKVTIIFGVGNKSEEYNEFDVIQIQVVANDLQRIMAQRRAETALSSSEAYFRSLIENAADIITIVDGDGNVRYISPSVEHVVGLKTSELNGRSIYEYVHPDDKTVAMDIFARSVQNPGVTLSAEIRMRYNDGAWHIFEIVTQNMLQNEVLNGIIINSHDITDRRQAEHDLLREMNQLQTILNLYHRADTRIQDIEASIIEECVRISESQLGFFGLINEDETVMMAHLWSDQAMEGCAIDFKPVEFSIDHAGIWAEAIRKHETLIVNDYLKPDPRKKGYPKGHIPIKNLMSIPIIKGGKAVAIMAVANKKLDYNETDVLHLSLFLESVWDILKRVKAEEELRKTLNLLNSISESSTDSIYIKDIQGRYLLFNKEAAKVTGKKPEEVIGKDDYFLFPADEAKAVMDGDRRVLESGQVMTYEEVVTTTGGTVTYLSTKGPLCDSEGKVLGLFGIARDITERKRAEEALQESERRLADVVDFLPDATLAIDLSGKIIAWNRAMEEMSGAKAEDMLGKGDYEYAIPFYGIRRPILIDLAFGFNEEIEKKYDFVKREGKAFLAETYVTVMGVPHTIWGKAGPLYDSRGNITGAIESVRDVTELRQARDELEIRVRERTAELVQANKALQKSEAILRSVFKTTPVGLCVMKDRVFQSVNQTWLEICGYSESDIIGHTPRVLFEEEEEYERVGRKLYTRLSERDLASVQTKHRRKNGDIRDVIMTAAPLHLDDISLGMAVVTVEDITERKKAEEALRESETKYRRLHESMTEAYARVDLNGRIQETNHAYQSMLGYSEEELRHLTYSAITPEKWHAFEKNIIEEQILVRGHAEIYEKEYQRKDGSVFPIELSTFLIRDDAGNPAGMWAIVRDITERKKMETELRAAKDYLRTVFNNVYDAIFVHDLDGKVIDVNEKMLEIYRISREEAIGLNVIRDYSVTDEIMEELPATWNKVMSGENMFFEWKARRPKDGFVFDIEVFLTKLVLPDGNYILANVRDINKRKCAEEELRKYREKLEVMVAERTRELEEKTENLQAVNTALNVLLQKREEDKKILEERFVANIGSLVLPYVEKIKKNNLDAQQNFCLDIIEKNLNEILTPLLKNIQQFNLTPREVQVASLINDGKTTKEIANILGIAKGSIDTHRRNIRKKLGLDRASNLQSRLRFLEK